MNEEEREIVKKFERLYLKDFNNEKITNEDRLSYIECALMSNLIEKLQKENEELKADNYELNNRITDLLENIPVQKVKDKIEELKNISNAEELEDIMNRKNYTISELVQYVLQELLEGRKI